MKKKLLSVLSLSALAATAVSLSGCGLTDEELFNQNAKCVFLANEGPAGAGVNYYVIGTLRSYTAFTDEFIEKGGKVVWTSGDSDVIDVTPFNEGTATTPINKPDFGSPVTDVVITATVTMGSYVKEVTWNLLVEPKTIENETLKSIVEKFYARQGHLIDNAIEGSPVKTRTDGSTIIAMFVKDQNGEADRAGTAAIVTEGMDEFVISNIKGYAINITEDTSAEVINLYAPAIKNGFLNSTLSVKNSDGTSTNKTIYACLQEVASSKTIGGVTLSDSDYNAVKSLGIYDIYNHVVETLADPDFTTLTIA